MITLLPILQFDSPLPDNIYLPGSFLELVRHWHRITKGSVIEVRLTVRSAANWQKTGHLLLETLGTADSQVAVLIDGVGPFRDAIPGWMADVLKSTDHGSVNVQYVVDKQPRALNGKQSWHTNISWTSIQFANDANWLKTIWENMDSDLFDYGTDLVMLFYANSPVQKMELAFCETDMITSITTETSWLIPLDGNIGFVIGTPNQTSLAAINSVFASI